MAAIKSVYDSTEAAIITQMRGRGWALIRNTLQLCSYLVPWVSKGCWVIHVFQLASKGKEWKVQRGSQRSIICSLSVRLYTSSKAERRRRKRSNSLYSGLELCCSHLWSEDKQQTPVWNCTQPIGTRWRDRAASSDSVSEGRAAGRRKMWEFVFVFSSLPASLQNMPLSRRWQTSNQTNVVMQKKKKKEARPRNVYRLLFGFLIMPWPADA